MREENTLTLWRRRVRTATAVSSVVLRAECGRGPSAELPAAAQVVPEMEGGVRLSCCNTCLTSHSGSIGTSDAPRKVTMYQWDDQGYRVSKLPTYPSHARKAMSYVCMCNGHRGVPNHSQQAPVGRDAAERQFNVSFWRSRMCLWYARLSWLETMRALRLHCHAARELAGSCRTCSIIAACSGSSQSSSLSSTATAAMGVLLS